MTADEDFLRRIKEALSGGALFELIREDIRKDVAMDMLRDNVPIADIVKYSRLDEATVRQLQAEMEKQSA